MTTTQTRRRALFDGRIRTYIRGHRVAKANGGPVILFQCIGESDKPRPRDWGPEAA